MLNECLDIEYNGVYLKRTECSLLVLLGKFTVDELVGYRSVVVIGSGRISRVSVENLVVISRGGLVAIKELNCDNCFINGAVHPVVVFNTNCRKIVARNVIIGEVDADTAVFNERCMVKRIKRAGDIVLKDPYVWFEEMAEPAGVNFKLRYRPIGG